MVRWVVGSILHEVDLLSCFIPASAPRLVYHRPWHVLSSVCVCVCVCVCVWVCVVMHITKSLWLNISNHKGWLGRKRSCKQQLRFSVLDNISDDVVGVCSLCYSCSQSSIGVGCTISESNNHMIQCT